MISNIEGDLFQLKQCSFLELCRSSSLLSHSWVISWLRLQKSPAGSLFVSCRCSSTCVPLGVSFTAESLGVKFTAHRGSCCLLWPQTKLCPAGPLCFFRGTTKWGSNPKANLSVLDKLLFRSEKKHSSDKSPNTRTLIIIFIWESWSKGGTLGAAALKTNSFVPE